MTRGHIAAAGFGGFLVAIAGMLTLIQVLPLPRLERAVVGGLTFPMIWVAAIVAACVCETARRAWALELMLIATAAALAAVGFVVRS